MHQKGAGSNPGQGPCGPGRAAKRGPTVLREFPGTATACCCRSAADSADHADCSAAAPSVHPGLQCHLRAAPRGQPQTPGVKFVFSLLALQPTWNRAFS